MKYEDQIKSPKWQRKRLEIFHRDGFKCQMCGCEDKTLHVHHLHYLKDKEIWDYPNTSLITLCEDCHAYEHSIGDLQNDEYPSLKFAINRLRKYGVTNYEILMLLLDAWFYLFACNKKREVFDIVGDMAWTDEESELYFKNLREYRKNIHREL